MSATAATAPKHGQLGALTYDSDYTVVKSYADKATSSESTDSRVPHQEILDDKALNKSVYVMLLIVSTDILLGSL